MGFVYEQYKFTNIFRMLNSNIWRCFNTTTNINYKKRKINKMFWRFKNMMVL